MKARIALGRKRRGPRNTLLDELADHAPGIGWNIHLTLSFSSRTRPLLSGRVRFSSDGGAKIAR